MYEVFYKLAKELKTTEGVQRYLDTLEYNVKDTMKSAIKVYEGQIAHCMEGAFLAAAICEHFNMPPLIVSMESQDNLDHVIFVYKTQTGWGAIGKSRDDDLSGRKPVFRSIRDLVWSYYLPYIDETGRITGYQLAHLDETQVNWRFAKRNIWDAESYLIELKHKELKSSDKQYLRHKKKILEEGFRLSNKNWL